MRHHYLCTLKLGVALSLLNQTVHAQVVPGPRPTAAQCNSSVQVLSSNPRDTSALETLPGCGKAGTIQGAGQHKRSGGLHKCAVNHEGPRGQC
jgi:hypothetical protein